MVKQGQPAIDSCEDFKVLADETLKGMITNWVGDNGYDITDYTDITTLGLNGNTFYTPDLNPGDQGYRPPCLMAIDLEYKLTPTAATYVNANVGKVELGINAAEEITEVTFNETKSVQSDAGDSFKGQAHVAREVYDATKVDKFGYRALTEAEASDFEAAFSGTVEWEATADAADSDWSKFVKTIEDKMIGMSLTEAKKYAAGLSRDEYGYQYASMVVDALEVAIESDPIEAPEAAE